MEHIAEKSHVLGNLDKATPIELFFDLVFIVCMRSITPVLSSGEGDIIGWYECYTFVFCFVLMVQIWFSSTVLMNRCGTGGLRDAAFLLTNMFLLFLMTEGISTDWEYYFAFNVMWMLINANMILHWLLRYRSMSPEAAQANKTFISRVVFSHALAIVFVFASLFLDKVPAQVFCLIALLVGFVSWPNLSPLSESGREHLAERCALFLILAFGETFVGLSGLVSQTAETSGMFSAVLVAIVYFMVIVGMFLVYVVHLEKKLDVTRLGSGSRYMAITTLLLFCTMGATAAFETGLEGKSFFFMPNGDYFSFISTVYLFVFFLFIPFTKPPVRKGKGWLVARVFACFIPILAMLAECALLAVLPTEFSTISAAIISILVAVTGLAAFMLSSSLVFIIDYKAYTPKKEKRRRLKR